GGDDQLRCRAADGRRRGGHAGYAEGRLSWDAGATCLRRVSALKGRGAGAGGALAVGRGRSIRRGRRPRGRPLPGEHALRRHLRGQGDGVLVVSVLLRVFFIAVIVVVL